MDGQDRGGDRASASARTRASRPPATAGAAARIALTLNWDHVGRERIRRRGRLARKRRAAARRRARGERARLPRADARRQRDLRRREHRRGASRSSSGRSTSRQRFGDRDVEMIALVGQRPRADQERRGRARARSCSTRRPPSAVCGELRPFSTGLVYCITISSCQDLGDFRRAAEWTEEANRWCDRLEVTGFPGACRHPPGRGACGCAATGPAPSGRRRRPATSSRTSSAAHGGGYYEIGEIRRRQRRLRRRRGGVRARERARPRTRARALAAPPRRGQGRRRRRRDPRARSRRPRSRSARLRRLPAQVEVAIAAGDLATARAAADGARAHRRRVQDRRPPGAGLRRDAAPRPRAHRARRGD